MTRIGQLDTTHDMYLPDKRARGTTRIPPTAPPTGPALYTSHEARRLTGASLRNLQWWDEQGILCPVQSLHKRRYTEDQIDELKRIKALREAGVRLVNIRRYLKWQYTSVLKITVPTVVNGTLIVPKP